MARNLEVVSNVFMIAACAVIIWFGVVQLGTSRNSQAEPAVPPMPTVSAARVDTVDVRIPIRARAGETHPTSGVALVEFSDYQCPFCGAYSRTTYPEIWRRYVENRIITYVFLNFPIERIHPFSFQASEAAECAGQQAKFWGMHHSLFNNQEKLKKDGLMAYAKNLNLNIPMFRKCLASEAGSQIRNDIATAQEIGVTGTPTFFLGMIESGGVVRATKQIKGAQPYEVFDAALRDVLEQSNSRSARR